MRLQKVATGQRLPARLKIGLIRMVTRDEDQPPDIVKLLLYRPEFFGREMTALGDIALHQPAAWTIGERELFAAFVSRKSGCPF